MIPYFSKTLNNKSKLLKNSNIKIKCKQCGITNTTLRKYNENYYCDICYPSTVVSELINTIKK